MPQLIHTIPLGGDEPMHVCDASCWCKPLLEDNYATVIHHANDCREVRERHGSTRRDECWVIVAQLVPEPP